MFEFFVSVKIERLFRRGLLEWVVLERMLPGTNRVASQPVGSCFGSSVDRLTRCTHWETWRFEGLAMLSRRRVLSVVAATWVLCHGGDVRGATAALSRLPNIVYILADDLGYGDVQALNPERGKIATPHLDKLAAQSMVFTDAHSSAAVCTPSRYGILTGRYNWRTQLQMGILDVRRDPPLIAADRLTVPGFLKKHGYHTAGFGKWHLGWNVPIEGDRVQTTQPLSDGPTTRGFDEYHCVDLRYFPPYMYTVNDRFDGAPLREWTDTKNAPAMPPTDADFADALPWTADATIHYLGQRRLTSSDSSRTWHRWFRTHRSRSRSPGRGAAALASMPTT